MNINIAINSNKGDSVAMEKTIVQGFLLLAAVYFLSSCSAQFEAHNAIYDQDEALAQSGDKFSYVSRVGSATSNSAVMDFETFAGVDTLWNASSEGEGAIELTYRTAIDRGEFKFIIVGPDQQVTTLFSGSRTGKQRIPLDPGQTRLKIVGRSAAGEVDFRVNPVGDGAIRPVDDSDF